jgi:hypothetical protein
VNQLVPFTDRAPALIAAVGERASYRFFEFFTANIRNPHTRRAYARAAVEFFDWLCCQTLVAVAFCKATTSPSSAVGLSPTSSSRVGPAAYFFVGVNASLARSE